MSGDDLWHERNTDDGIDERVSQLTIAIEDYYANSPTTMTKEYTDANNRWPDLLETFIRALEAHYGYSIMDRIYIQENGNPFGLEGWPGGVISRETEEDADSLYS